MLPVMCKEAGIAHRTNHGLHAMGATNMLRANVPEKVIQAHTCHLSLKALRMYENPTDEQHSAACSVLVDRRNVTPPEVLKLIQPLAGPVSLTMVQASSTTHNTSVVPSALFGSARNCTYQKETQTKGANGLQFSLKEEVLASNNLFLHKSG